jgi:hypothetical protein
MRCMMMASLRATATQAFLLPTRLASFTPHARSADHSWSRAGAHWPLRRGNAVRGHRRTC